MQLMKEWIFGDDGPPDEKSHLDGEYVRRLQEGGTITQADVIDLETRGKNVIEESQEIERLMVRLSGVRHEQNEATRLYRDHMEGLQTDEADTIKQITERHGRIQQWADRYAPPSMPPAIPLGEKK